MKLQQFEFLHFFEKFPFLSKIHSKNGFLNIKSEQTRLKRTPIEIPLNRAILVWSRMASSFFDKGHLET